MARPASSRGSWRAQGCRSRAAGSGIVDIRPVGNIAPTSSATSPSGQSGIFAGSEGISLCAARLASHLAANSFALTLRIDSCLGPAVPPECRHCRTAQRLLWKRSEPDVGRSSLVERTQGLVYRPAGRQVLERKAELVPDEHRHHEGDATLPTRSNRTNLLNMLPFRMDRYSWTCARGENPPAPYAC